MLKGSEIRSEFLKQQQENHKAYPKKFWKAISTIIPSKKQKSAEIWLHDRASVAAGTSPHPQGRQAASTDV